RPTSAAPTCAGPPSGMWISTWSTSAMPATPPPRPRTSAAAGRSSTTHRRPNERLVRHNDARMEFWVHDAVVCPPIAAKRLPASILHTFRRHIFVRSMRSMGSIGRHPAGGGCRSRPRNRGGFALGVGVIPLERREVEDHAFRDEPLAVADVELHRE